MHSHMTDRQSVHEVMPDGWYALYTRHQHEKSAEGILLDKGFEVLLPLYRSIRRWKDRNQSLLLPLFPSYLFVRANLERRLEILRTPGVCWLVGNAAGPIALPDREIEDIRKLAESQRPYQPHPFLNTGERVRVIKGSLCGLEGILTRIKNQGRVVLSIELLQRSAAVEVDLDILEPVSPQGLFSQAINN